MVLHILYIIIPKFSYWFHDQLCIQHVPPEEVVYAIHWG